MNCCRLFPAISNPYFIPRHQPMTVKASSPDNLDTMGSLRVPLFSKLHLSSAHSNLAHTINTSKIQGQCVINHTTQLIGLTSIDPPPREL